MKTVKKISKLVTVLYFFASTFMLTILLYVLYYSLQYWTINYPYGAEFNAVMFYVAIGITIVTILAQWIEGRIRAIRTILNKGGENGRKRS